MNRMETIKCAIVDDEPLALDLLQSYVEKTPYLELAGRCSNALAAMKLLHEQPVDLLFLDIQMPELNGIEFSKTIVQDKVKIIFTTAFSEYAIEGFKVNALDYLLKPISYSDFLSASERALKWFRERSKSGTDTLRYIYVKTEYKLLQIELDKIRYIEGLKDYVKIFVEESNIPILSLMSMKNMEELLPATDFVRVHRSYIVRGDKVKVIERNRIVFDKVYVPISDSYKSDFMKFMSRKAIISF